MSTFPAQIGCSWLQNQGLQAWNCLHQQFLQLGNAKTASRTAFVVHHIRACIFNKYFKYSRVLTSSSMNPLPPTPPYLIMKCAVMCCGNWLKVQHDAFGADENCIFFQVYNQFIVLVAVEYAVHRAWCRDAVICYLVPTCVYNSPREQMQMPTHRG